MNLLSKLFSIDSSPQHKRNCAIEGIRGLAILLVFVCHYADIVVPQLRVPANWQRVAESIAQVGRTGVALFFVLSGYLIYRAVSRRDFKLLRFWARRVQRIYPTFLAVFAIYLCLWLLRTGTDKSGEQLSSRIPHDSAAAWIYILQNLLFMPGIFPVKPLMNVAWSLSYEWLFYLFVPLGAIALGRISRPQARMRLVAVFSAMYLVVSYWAPAVSSAPLMRCVQFVAAHNGLVLFLAGALVYERLQIPSRDLVRRAEWEPFAVATILAALSIPFFVHLFRPQPHAYRANHHADVAITLCVFVGYGLLLYCSVRGNGIVERALSLKPLRYLGNISYSFYLIHGLPIHVTASVAARAAHFFQRIPGSNIAAMLVILPICLLFTTCVSLALFVAVERPLSLRSESKNLPERSLGRSPAVYSPLPPSPERFAEDTLTA